MKKFSFMQYRTLGNTGLLVSTLSFGASSLGGVFHDVQESECLRTVHLSLDAGINFIDVSPYYGETRAESMLGKALKGVARHRYILATKVGQYGKSEFDFSRASVLRSLDESLGRLGVEYIDLLQCHDIEFAEIDQIVTETLPVLAELKAAGRIGHVGITGLPLKIFRDVIDRVPDGLVETILSFCHYELNDHSLADLLPYMKSKGIGVINAAPTGMGLLTGRPLPDWHPAGQVLRDGCAKAVGFCRMEGIDIVKLAIQFAIHHPGIATTLVGSASPENMARNVEYAESPVDFSVMAAVLEVLQPVHNHNFTRGRPENRDPLYPPL
jgi:L-galactose dehydrogenase